MEAVTRRGDSTSEKIIRSVFRVKSVNENAEKVEKQVDTCNIVLSVLRVSQLSK